MRLKRFRKNPTNASPTSSSEPVASPAIQHAAAPTDPRIGPARATRADHSAQERDEERRARRDALAAELDDVPELVDEDQKDEADCERPPPEPGVGGDRDDHREASRDHFELEQQSAELDDQKTQADQRGGEPPQKTAEPPARLHGLVATITVG